MCTLEVRNKMTKLTRCVKDWRVEPPQLPGSFHVKILTKILTPPKIVSQQLQPKSMFFTVSLAGWFPMSWNSAVWAGHSIATLWTPHMPIFWPKSNWAKNGAKKLKNQGKIALLRPLRMKCGPNISKWVHLTSQPVQSCGMVVIELFGTLFGLSDTSGDPKRGMLGQKRAFWGPWPPQRPPIPGQSVW